MGGEIVGSIYADGVDAEFLEVGDVSNQCWNID
jgi:hypothetical protein